MSRLTEGNATPSFRQIDIALPLLSAMSFPLSPFRPTWKSHSTSRQRPPCLLVHLPQASPLFPPVITLIPQTTVKTKSAHPSCPSPVIQLVPPSCESPHHPNPSSDRGTSCRQVKSPYHASRIKDFGCPNALLPAPDAWAIRHETGSVVQWVRSVSCTITKPDLKNGNHPRRPTKT